MMADDMRPRGDPQEPQFSGVFSLTFLSVAALALLLGLGGRGLLRRLWQASPRPVEASRALDAEENGTVALFEGVSPSVVYIESLVLLENPWTGGRTVSPEGSGSGFVWDEDGHIVTNLHVVAGGHAPRVTLRDGSVFVGRVVGVAPDYDLAVIEIDAPAGALRPIPLGRSADLRVGQKTFAVGYPFGLEQTLTTGIVSGLGRAIQSQSQLEIHGVIQTDAAINPGNSGGPLLDAGGRLIGVNTAIASATGANTGVGFAVPIDTVNRIVPRILNEGSVERAGLGISVGNDLLARDEGRSGAVVAQVFPRTPAARAGMVGASQRGGEVFLGDLIVGIDDQPIRGGEDLYQALEPYRPGEEVRVTLDRPGEQGRFQEVVRVRLAPLR
jgi:S1-C subfamily serine protease